MSQCCPLSELGTPRKPHQGNEKATTHLQTAEESQHSFNQGTWRTTWSCSIAPPPSGSASLHQDPWWISSLQTKGLKMHAQLSFLCCQATCSGKTDNAPHLALEPQYLQLSSSSNIAELPSISILWHEHAPKYKGDRSEKKYIMCLKALIHAQNATNM